ncbi:MAG TPA: VCBS repeat-containing protein [Candidatus Polarisedimenticolia bacterium]|nr:VCBS repeat-containing protein [Candidatus Polarisedimenticolia bacterium]
MSRLPFPNTLMIAVALATAEPALSLQDVRVFPAPMPTPAWVPCAVADLDGDQLPDIAFADSVVGVNVRFGRGNGTYFEPVVLEATRSPETGADIDLGDVTGDGLPDIVVTWGSWDSPASTVRTHVALGGGEFSASVPSSLPIPSDVFDCQERQLHDIDGDGLLDLVAVTYDPVSSDPSSLVTVARSTGDGGFVLATQLVVPLGLNQGPLAVGDFFPDGVPDIATAFAASQSTDDLMAVFVGTGGVSFLSPPEQWPAPGSPLAFWPDLAAGDIDLDGALDLVFSSHAFDGLAAVGQLDVVSWDAAFSPHTILSMPDDAGGLPAVGDLDEDGWPDVVVGPDPQVSGGFPRNLSIFRNDGHGALLPRQATGAVKSGRPDIVELDGDGIPDVFIGTYGSALFFGNGDGTFGEPTELTFGDAKPIHVAATDIDADGAPDLLVGLNEPDSSLVVHIGDAAGGFGESVSAGESWAFVTPSASRPTGCSPRIWMRTCGRTS